MGSNISVTIGSPMDLFGNFVDDDGNSLDKHGNPVNIRDYFVYRGSLTENAQRESEYTRMLSEKIVKEFHRNARVFSSHLCAFVAFELMKKKFGWIDLYSLFRIPNDELNITYEEFRRSFIKLRQQIFSLQEENKIQVADHLNHPDIDELIAYGITNVGIFHTHRPLIRNKEGDITTADLKTLYYYRNRLDGYGLENYL
jgi:glycerol-3-phosphate O-acyltransferase